MAQADAADLARLLDEAHAAVLVADFARLADLAAETEAILDAIGPIRDRPTAESLRRRVLRNEACLRAAARGLRAARRRLAEIGQPGWSLVTYDGRGRRAELDLPPATLIHRF